MRNLRRAIHVARTEPLGVLLAKIRRQLRPARPQRPPRPRVLARSKASAPLSFAPAAAPVASIIVSGGGNARRCRRCLAALWRYGGDVPYEVIVLTRWATVGSRSPAAECSGEVTGVRLVRWTDGAAASAGRNHCARLARGSVLIFLDADTQVQPGWLAALTAHMAHAPDAGVLGSCLLTARGRLLAAGYALEADGSVRARAQGGDPARPEYRYVRDCEVVSSAAMAVRAEVFAALGGLDPELPPGLYQDADFSLRARRAGFRVRYQPRARVVLLGPSRDAGYGDRARTVGHQRFTQRWRALLMGDSDLHAPPSGSRRRALIVDSYMLTPDKESGSLRMLHFIEILQGLGFDVTFAAANLEAPEPYASDLQQRGVEVLFRPYVRSLPDHLRVRGARYVLVILSRSNTAARLLQSARRRCRQARVVFDTVDLHFLREQRLADLTGDARLRRLAQRREQEEMRLIAQADVTLVVSRVERELLARRLPRADVRVVSNIHRIQYSEAGFAERHGLLFIGSFSHPPNTDGVLWFCRKILPRVLAVEPDICFWVIGADPPAEVRALGSERVRVLGHVPDVKPLFEAARLSVAPLRYGAGVKGKINQSLACGLPVVATPQAAEGMFLTDGESVLLADTTQAFAGAVLRLHRDRGTWERLSRGGLKVMEDHFSFAAARRAIASIGAV
ncbi:glycosyltransferase [Thiohalocapsa halophila]|uniref:glycosyltransferase n=1 Tax=Thiohalocapsa halophila TaxID=69359 RepID=UPI003F69042E